ncbi:MAG: plastocyanin/azurin family copper-binding protein [Rhodobacteraceae bacterium]|nr:plastocyanin/azurin family copper-binding protein [Paracoccaceae bacterium]
MKSIAKTFVAASLALGAFSIPALADTDAGVTLTVNLWDAGAKMETFADHRVINNVPRYEDSMGIMISAATIPAGEVTFLVTNGSADIEHEMVVAALPDMAAGLPYEEDTARVNEDIDGANLGEVPELAPGASGGLTIRLKSGTYVLYCNIPGHYASGMWAILTVE